VTEAQAIAQIVGIAKSVARNTGAGLIETIDYLIAGARDKYMKCKYCNEKLVIVKDSRKIRSAVEAIPRVAMRHHHVVVTNLAAKSTEDKAIRRHQRECSRNPDNHVTVSPQTIELIQEAGKIGEK
jgi:hypothetical protein